MIFRPPFFGRMTAAMVNSAVAWTQSVPLMDTAAALMANAVLMVSNNRTGCDKSGHVLRDAAPLLANAVALLMNETSILTGAASRMATTLLVEAYAASQASSAVRGGSSRAARTPPASSGCMGVGAVIAVRCVAERGATCRSTTGSHLPRPLRRKGPAGTVAVMKCLAFITHWAKNSGLPCIDLQWEICSPAACAREFFHEMALSIDSNVADGFLLWDDRCSCSLRSVCLVAFVFPQHQFSAFCVG